MDEIKNEDAAPTRKETIEEELRGIYEDEPGVMPDLSALDAPVRSWRRRGLGAAAGLLILTAALAGWFFFSGGFSFRSSEYLSIDVTARPLDVEEERSEPLLSGTPSRIAIRYQNVNDGPLASLSLRLNLPDTLLIDRFVPPPTSQDNTWELGSLKEGSDGLIELYGTLLGDVPSVQKIQIVATYRPANFSSEFDDISVFNLPLEKSALQLEVSAPDTASSGEPIELSFELLNPSRSAVEDIELDAIIPEGFRVIGGSPAVGDGFTWTIPRMEAHSKASFTLLGAMSADTRGLHDVGGRVFLALQTGRYRQTETLKSVDVSSGALSVSVIVNGSSRDQNADPGTLLRVSVSLENASEAPMRDVELELQLSGEESGTLPIDWEGEGFHAGGGTRTGESFVWNKTDLDVFESLAPGEEVNVDLTLPLFASLPEGALDSLVLTAAAAASSTAGAAQRITLSTTPITVRMNSLVDVYASALFHDTQGATIGSGPLPPRVGETTTYAIVWSVKGDLHPLEGLALETELPAHVQFVETSDPSLGDLSYHVDRRRVRWEVERLEGNASARFTVSVTPEAEDIGSFLKLTNPTTLGARDAETGGLIRRESPALTTVLLDDAFAEDDGIVVAE